MQVGSLGEFIWIRRGEKLNRLELVQVHEAPTTSLAAPAVEVA